MTQPTFVESSIQREVAAVAAPERPDRRDVQRREPDRRQRAVEVRRARGHDRRQPACSRHRRDRGDPGRQRRDEQRRRHGDGDVEQAHRRDRCAGGPSYAFRQIDPVNNADGGAPGANIRVGLLYRTDQADLGFVDRPGGTSTNNTSVVVPKNQPQLTFSPGRLGTDSTAFDATRKPLVGEFVEAGRCSSSSTTSARRATTRDLQPLAAPDQLQRRPAARPGTGREHVRRHGAREGQ